MRLGWEITAGQAGGDIDAFLDLMANWRDFYYTGAREGYLKFAGRDAAKRLEINMAWNGAVTLISGRVFGGHSGKLRVVSTRMTVIEGDVDGDGRADFTLTLSGLSGFDTSALLLV